MHVIDFFVSIPYSSPPGLIALGFAALGLLIGLVRFHRSTRAVAYPSVIVDFVDKLNQSGWAGWQIKASVDSTRVEILCPCEGPAGITLLFDTDPLATDPEGTKPLGTGVPVLDATFRTKVGSVGVEECLRANRATLERLVPMLRGWRHRFRSIVIDGERAVFVFEKGHHSKTRQRLPTDQLRQALPQLVSLAGALLSAAWWHPPPSPAQGKADPYRGGGATDPDKPVWRVEDLRQSAPTVDESRPALSSSRLIEALRSGRLSWLSRAQRVDQGGPLPLAEQHELRPLRVSAADTGTGSEQDAAELPKGPRGYRLVQLAHLPYLGLLWGLTFLVMLTSSRCVHNSLAGAASEHWPSTAGRILSSEVTSRKKDDSTSHMYKPVVRYGYEVGGERHKSDRVSFQYAWALEGYYPERAHAQEVTDRYPKGQDVTVYYDPDSPWQSTLEPGAIASEQSKAIGGLITVGFFWCFIGLTLLGRLLAWRARRRADQLLQSGR